MINNNTIGNQFGISQPFNQHIRGNSNQIINNYYESVNTSRASISGPLKKFNTSQAPSHQINMINPNNIQLPELKVSRNKIYSASKHTKQSSTDEMTKIS